MFRILFLFGCGILTLFPTGSSVSVSAVYRSSCVRAHNKCLSKCYPREQAYITTSSHLIPRLCPIPVKISGACQGATVSLCPSPTTIPDICQRRNVRHVPCEEKGCFAVREIMGRCTPNSQGQYNCSHSTNGKCRVLERAVDVPCTEPINTCEECRKRVLLKKCKTNIRTQKIVPCDQLGEQETVTLSTMLPKELSKTQPIEPASSSEADISVPIPSSMASPRQKPIPQQPNLSPHPLPKAEEYVSALEVPFPDKHIYSRNLRCFASFYDNRECGLVNDFCRVDSKMFDTVACTMNVCDTCGNIGDRPASNMLQRYCRMLSVDTCKKVDLEAELSQELFVLERPIQKGFCVQEIVGESLEACDEDMKEWEMCHRGCRVEKCKLCVKNNHFCARKGNLCEKSEIDHWVCEKQIMVDVPCNETTCTKEIEGKHLCGHRWVGEIGEHKLLPYCESDQCSRPRACK